MVPDTVIILKPFREYYVYEYIMFYKIFYRWDEMNIGRKHFTSGTVDL
jgi:hypothetical protein